MDDIDVFETERPRLLRIASRVLGDPTEAEDIVQQAWLRLDRTRRRGAHGADTSTGTPTETEIESLPAWLTTVTTRLCLDRLRARVPVAVDEPGHWRQDPAGGADVALTDPAEEVALADTVGVALTVVLDRLSAKERVAFVLHDSFGFEFTTIAAVLDCTPPNARKLASRARAKISQPRAEDRLADWQVVDAFMAAARTGEFRTLLELLAPDATVSADDAAALLGTPSRLDGREQVATFFNGSARAALPVFVEGRPASAWFHRGEAKVVFDFEVVAGQVRGITFRADGAALATVVRRDRDRLRARPDESGHTEAAATVTRTAPPTEGETR